jgi:hypothetical protein
MLKSLDVVIGFAVVMLLASVAVTMLTQVVVAALNSRGKELCRGLAALVKQAHPDLADHGRDLAEAVLRHPLIATRHGRLGGVVQREEFVMILLELAAGTGAHTALRGVFRQQGITDPAATLRAIRREVAQLEADKPELASHVRHTMAFVKHASNDVVQRLTGWFDASMGRVSQAFQNRLRFHTAAFALLLALAIQLDAIGLLNRLAIDDQLRRTLVAEAQSVSQTAGVQVQTLRELALSPLVVPPEDWRDHWNARKIPGILLAAILMSLGAPFWHDTLKNLLRLRPLLAGKEEAERDERRTAQAAHS